ncbi:acyl-CoA N-acyltransferase [Gongronella butleri]|nr:acyl-CoA N-acyltransferase [Gongronella butleri]
MVQESSIIVRQATPEDLVIAHEIEKVINEAYCKEGGWTGEHQFVTGLRMNAEELSKTILDTSQPLYLAIDTVQGRVVGTVQLSHERVPPGEAEVRLLSVDHAYQSKGIGGKLVRMCMDEMRRHGNRTAVMHLFEGRDELLAWYEKKLGFQRTGGFLPFPKPEILIDKSSKFIALKKDL